MLAILSGEPLTESYLSLPEPVYRDIKPYLDKENNIAVFLPENRKAVLGKTSRIQSNQKGTIRLKIESEKSLPFSTDIIAVLFASSEWLYFDNSLWDELIRFQNLWTLPSLTVRAHANHNREYEFSVCDSLESICIKSILSQSAVRSLRERAERFREDFNRAIRTGISGSLEPVLVAGRQTIRDLLEAVGIRPERLPRRRWDIYLEQEMPYFPWELIDLPSPPVIRIPGHSSDTSESPSPESLPKLTLIYSPDLEHARQEAGLLSQILPQHFDFTVFSEENWEDYRDIIAQSRMIHFVGHGQLDTREQGMISLNHTFQYELPVSPELSCAVLNCCHVGSVTSGIVESLLRAPGSNPRRLVVASPYEIGDAEGRLISEFYRYFSSSYPLLSFLIAALVNKSLSVFYRPYLIFQDKI